MFDTDTADVTKSLSKEILRNIERLKKATANLEEQVKTMDPTRAIAQGWLENMTFPFESIKRDVNRINGAVLVRAKD
jgi:hypothetical protein